jgi:uncharacterized protein YndB with AHSA1/START domain
MITSASDQSVQTLEITKDVQVAAPIEIVFQTLLEHLGPLHETGPDYPLPMKLEPWPGGRWYRDLGNNAGHLWGHVQVIKPPKLLEISGPLFMSYPAISHLQYRLTEDGEVTRLAFIHSAIGRISADHRQALTEGMEPWTHTLQRIRDAAERRPGLPGGSR